MSNKPVQIERIGLDINHVQYAFNRPLSPVPRHPGVVLHHMGTGSFTGDTQRHPGRVVHDMHLRKGWAGIGYHGIATQQGRYYTGRTYRHTGSHAGTNDGNRWFGLLWYGGLGDQPAEQALHTLAQAIAWVAIDNDFEPSAATVQGHRQHASTACPGNLFAHIPDLIRRAKHIISQVQTHRAETPAAVVQGTLPPPVQIGTCRALIDGMERDGLLINNRAYVLAADLGGVWDPQTRTITIQRRL